MKEHLSFFISVAKGEGFMRRTRVLGIAPYAGMRVLMMECAASMPQLDLTIWVVNQRNGASSQACLSAQDADVILCASDDAEHFYRRTTLPIVEIECSAWDILRAIQQAGDTEKRFCLIGSPAFVQNAPFLTDAWCEAVDFRAVYALTDTAAALRSISAKPDTVILCDPTAHQVAQQMGIPALCVTYGRASVTAALRQAARIGQLVQQVNEKLLLTQSLLERYGGALLVYIKPGKVLFQQNTAHLPMEVHAAANRLSQSGADKHTFICQHILWHLERQPLQMDGAVYTVVTIRKDETAQHGVRFSSGKSELPSQALYGFVQRAVDEYASANAALLISGETGTGKSEAVKLFYARSHLHHSVFCDIDCARLDQDGWNYLLTPSVSPFWDSGIILWLHGFRALTDAQFNRLSNCLQDSDAERRNRLIFTLPAESGTLSLRRGQLLDRFSCITIELLPLRCCKQELPNIARLYLRELAPTPSAAPVLSQEAAQMLETYDWPGNRRQLARVLRKLSQVGAEGVIDEEEMRRALDEEAQLYISPNDMTLDALLHNRTLEEVNAFIVQRVLEQVDGNHTLAAQRLGISRTTLWRRMGRTNDQASSE